MASDSELLRRYVREGAQAAFAELTRRHISLVYSAALRRTGGNRAWAEDITQQVFIKLAEQASRLARHPVLSAWLYVSTRNTAINFIKSELRRRAREKEALMMQIPESRAEGDPNQIRLVLDELMDRLKERERVALILRFFEGQAFLQIGAKLAISEDAARRRVDRALEKMRAGLSWRGIESSTAILAVILTEEAATAASPGLLATIAGTAWPIPSSAGGGVGFGYLMSTTKVSIGLAGILGVAALLSLPAIGIAVREWQAGRDARSALAQANEEYRTEQKRLSGLKTAAAVAQRTQAELGREAQQLTSAIGGGTQRAGSAGGVPVARNGKADARRFLDAFPQARAMLADYARGKVVESYSGFFRAAGFTPAQIDQFENLAVDSWLGRLSLSPSSFSALSYNDLIPADQLAQTLGEQAVQQFQDYNRTVMASLWANRFAAVIGSNSPPLTPDQIDQLTQVVANNSTSYQNGRTVENGSIDWSGVQSQAQAVVSPAQWPTTEAVLNYTKSSQALAQARAAAQANAPAP